MFIAHKRNNTVHPEGSCSRGHLQTEYIEIQSWLCTACGSCISECPRKVIGKVKWFKHQHAHIDRADECIGCKKCVKTCPNGAIIDLKPKVMPTERKAKANNKERLGLEQNPALRLTDLSRTLYKVQIDVE